MCPTPIVTFVYSGEFLVNGYPKEQDTFSRIVG